MSVDAAMPTFVRYWLFQLPGTAVAAVLLLWAHAAEWISGAVAAALLLAWVVKDAALYPLTRDAYRGGEPRLGPRVGQLATVRRPLTPRGTVTVDGTLWNARLDGSAAAADTGTTVRIVASRGLVLIVAPVDRETRVPSA